MKRCLATLAAVLATGTSVHAQPQIGSYSPPVVNTRPVVSPYLNLNNRNGTNAAINYYGIVQPQIQNQQAIQQLQVQQGQMALGMNQTQGAGLLANEEIAPRGESWAAILITRTSSRSTIVARGVRLPLVAALPLLNAGKLRFVNRGQRQGSQALSKEGLSCFAVS